MCVAVVFIKSKFGQVYHFNFWLNFRQFSIYIFGTWFGCFTLLAFEMYACVYVCVCVATGFIVDSNFTTILRLIHILNNLLTGKLYVFSRFIISAFCSRE